MLLGVFKCTLGLSLHYHHLQKRGLNYFALKGLFFFSSTFHEVCYWVLCKKQGWSSLRLTLQAVLAGRSVFVQRNWLLCLSHGIWERHRHSCRFYLPTQPLGLQINNVPQASWAAQTGKYRQVTASQSIWYFFVFRGLSVISLLSAWLLATESFWQGNFNRTGADFYFYGFVVFPLSKSCY